MRYTTNLKFVCLIFLLFANSIESINGLAISSQEIVDKINFRITAESRLGRKERKVSAKDYL